jgi:hypothetical protein
LLDELLIGGELQETSRKVVTTTIKLADETEKADLLIASLRDNSMG